MMIDIIKTGSGGNSILLCDSVLVDIGTPYKYLKDFSGKIEVVLLTHCHSDHLNKTSIRNLHIENEKIKFCCGGFLVDVLLNIGVPRCAIVEVEAGKVYKSGGVSFSPVNLYHDVPNIGWRVIEGKHRHFYATDTFSLEGISAKNYDTSTIECNHEITAALKVIEEASAAGEFCHLNRAIKTHLSVDKAIKFAKENNIKTLYPIHVGATTADSVFAALDREIGGYIRQ